jgi:type II secretory pathway component GspD/PulD (secretin)
MGSIPQRVILPALVLTWALSHVTLLGGETKGKKGGNAGREQPSVEQIRKALDQPIVLDFSGQSVMEALQHLRQKTNIEFNLDQLALASMNININDNGEQSVTMKSTGGKLSVALRKLLNTQQLTYVIFEDAILITTAELATTRQMKQRVNLDVEEVPLAKAVRELARNYAFNLVIDPKISKDSQKPVSLTLDGTSLETSVRLLAEMAGLKAVRLDNVMFITNEERADKLRKEEKDSQPNMLDDPGMLLNPRAGFAVPAGIGGLAGLGGPAFRAVPLPPGPDDGVPPAPPPK